MKLRLAPFEPAMADDLVPMWREAFGQGVGMVDRNPLEHQRRYLFERVLPEHAVTVAPDDWGHLIGFVASNAVSISQLHVRVGWHRLGIGSALLERAKQASSASLWLYTFARNALASHRPDERLVLRHSLSLLAGRTLKGGDLSLSCRSTPSSRRLLLPGSTRSTVRIEAAGGTEDLSPSKRDGDGEHAFQVPAQVDCALARCSCCSNMTGADHGLDDA